MRISAPLKPEHNATSNQVEDLTEKISRRITEEVNSLKPLWAQLSPHIRVAIVTEANVYLSPDPDPNFFKGREERERSLIPAIEKELLNLRRASANRKNFEETCAALLIEQSALLPAPSNGIPSLSFALDMEAFRLSVLLENARNAYNRKRFGTKRSLHPLILMEEYIAQLVDPYGASRRITALQIADLLRFVLLSRGDNQTDASDPENLRKALIHFRNNPLNQAFLVRAKVWAGKRVLPRASDTACGDKS